MKLWQKVFLCTLALVMLAVDIASSVILQQSIAATISSEEQAAVRENTLLCVNISNNVAYKQLREDRIQLNREQINEVVDELVQSQSTSGTDLYVYLEEELVSSNGQTDALRLLTGDYRLQVQESPGCLTVTVESETGNHFLFAGSAIRLGNSQYCLYTCKDMTEIYNRFDEQWNFVKIISLICSVITAALLLGIVYFLLAPLGRVNRMLRKMAEGDYSLRISERGSTELRELSGNINLMAASVEENVNEIQQIADGRKMFIDSLAHEMKTPLTSILGFADILRIKREVTPQQRQEYAGIIVEEARRLRGLSGKLMELAVMHHTAMDIEKLPVAGFFEEIRLAVTPVLEKRGQKLQVFCGQEVVQGDKELLKSLFFNLIDNAAKASPEEAEITLSARLIRQKDGEWICCTVEDHGIGMSEEAVRRATEPFYMEDKSRSRKKGGAGLGLALCSEILQVHGGKLSITSQKGEGTKVHVFLPKEGIPHETQASG